MPKNWQLVPLYCICSKIVDGNHNPPAGLSYKTDYMMLSSQNIDNNTIANLNKVRYLSKQQYDIENKRTKIQVNDILFTSVGTIGRSCIFDSGLNIVFQRSVSVISSFINKQYLKYYLDAPRQQNIFIKESTGTAQKGFYLNQLAKLYVAVPPENEQKKIVRKLNNIINIL